jgi:hypothetical protein
MDQQRNFTFPTAPQICHPGIFTASIHPGMKQSNPVLQGSKSWIFRIEYPGTGYQHGPYPLIKSLGGFDCPLLSDFWLYVDFDSSKLQEVLQDRLKE